MRDERGRRPSALHPRSLRAVSLGLLLDKGFDPQDIQVLLDKFSCRRDEDVVRFLRRHAIGYEESQSTVTNLYLCGDAEAFADMQLERSLKGITIEGFFSVQVAPTVFHCEADGSRVEGVLIAQIARCDGIPKSDLPGSLILSDAETVAASFIPRHVVAPTLIECKNCRRLLAKYRKLGYSYLQKNPMGYNQLYKPIEGTGEARLSTRTR